MKFVHLLSRITGSFWLITEDALTNISSLIETRLAGLAVAPGALRAEDMPCALPPVAGEVVIPICGVIGKRLSPMEMACGGCDIDELDEAFTKANADPMVSRIILHIDSPGGTVTGVPELAAKIYETKMKPVEAVSDTLIGSAAYWLASAADRISVTPTTVVGSIGAVLQVRETLDSKSADGRTRLRVFRSGPDKFAGADAPLSVEQADALQAQVDQLGGMFRAGVLKSRPAVAADSMTGRTYLADEALARRLVDAVVPSLATAAR